jgi:hypothetical protein
VFESQEMKGILAGAVNRLGEREKIVITLTRASCDGGLWPAGSSALGGGYPHSRG